MEYNVLLINGSNREGNILNILSCIKNQVLERDCKNIKFEIVNLKDINLNFCESNMRCFKKGTCLLDEEDAGESIKKQLLESDIIFFATPVYLKDISAYLKRLFERLVIWSHTMRLYGKYAVIIVSASNNNIDRVANYMFEVLSTMGIVVIGVFYHLNIMTTDQVSNQISNLIDNLINVASAPIMATNSYIDNYFLFAKKKYKNRAGHYEMEFWNENCDFNRKTFFEVVNQK